MKKRFLLFISVIGFTMFGSTVLADTNKLDTMDVTKDSVITYQDDEITMGTFNPGSESLKVLEETLLAQESKPTIQTRGTTVGPGGLAKIYTSDNRKIIFWMVRPATGWPWSFTGNVALRYYSSHRRDYTVYGAGAIGTSSGGYINLPANNGGQAYLTGTAYAVNGSGMRVLPGCSTSY